MSKKSVIGSGGGGGAKNASDSLFSGDAIEVILGVGEGPVHGIKGDTIEEQLNHVYLDGTPILSQNGDKNFRESQIILSYERGTPVSVDEDPDFGQTPIPYLLGGSASPIAVGMSLEPSVSVVRQVPSAYRNQYSKIEVRIMVTHLAEYTKKGTKELSAGVRIRYKKTSEASWTQRIEWIRGKTVRGGFVRSFEYYLTDTSEDYQIEVRLISPNTEEQVRELTWLAYEVSNPLIKDGEVIREIHPGTAMMALVSKIGENLARVPNITAVWKGLLCAIPSNYNPETRQYDETTPWDGSFRAGKYWTNNPFWIAREVILNPRFGMARYNPLVTVDDYSLYEEAKYADTLRPVEIDGVVHQKPLFTFNASITEPMQGLELVNYILGSANAQAIEYSSGHIRVVADRNTPSVMTVTREMCMQLHEDVCFTYSATNIKDRFNEVNTTYTEPHLDWQQQFLGPFIYPDVQETQGVNVYEFNAIGCIYAWEARYKSFFRLISAQTETLSLSFTIPSYAINWDVYDIIDVVDPSMDWGMSGRAILVEGRDVQLRDPLYFEETGSYEFHLQTKDNGVQVRSFTIASVGSYQQLTLNENITAELAKYPAFSIMRDGANPGKAKPFRVMSISPVDPQKHIYAITAVEVNRNKYQQALNEEFGDRPRYNFAQPRRPGEPQNLRVDYQFFVLNDDQLVPHLQLVWDSEEREFLGLTYELFVSKNGDPFQSAGITRMNTAELPIEQGSTYSFFVKLHYQGQSWDSDVYEWEVFELMPHDIADSDLILSAEAIFDEGRLQITFQALLEEPALRGALDLFASNSIWGTRYQLLAIDSDNNTETVLRSGEFQGPRLTFNREDTKQLLTASGGSLRITYRLVVRPNRNLDLRLPHRRTEKPSTVLGSGPMWYEARTVNELGEPLGGWSEPMIVDGFVSSGVTRQLEVSVDGISFSPVNLVSPGAETKARWRTITNDGPSNWTLLDLTPVASGNYTQVAFIRSGVRPPKYDEFPLGLPHLNIQPVSFPIIVGIELLTTAHTLSAELTLSTALVDGAQVEWWVAEKPSDDTEANFRKIAVQDFLFGEYIGAADTEYLLKLRFKYFGLFSDFSEPYDFRTQAVGFDDLGINIEKVVFIYRRSATPPPPLSSSEGTFISPVPEGWSQTVPDGEQMLWMTSRVFYLDGTATTWNPIKPAERDLLVQYSFDGEGAWTSDYQEGYAYMRKSLDGGLTWSAPILIKGEDGADGSYWDFRFKRSNTQPIGPTTQPSPVGWSDTPPEGDEHLWMIRARKSSLGEMLGVWSIPIRLTGEKGEDGEDGEDGISIQVQYSTTGGHPWRNSYTVFDVYMRQSSDGGTTWGPPLRIVGEDGQDGDYVDYRFRRAASAPPLPTGSNPDGWSDAPPVGTLFLWMTTAKKSSSGELLSSWSIPVRLTGEKGEDGAAGRRGTTHLYIPVAVEDWNDTLASDAFQNDTYQGAQVADRVTLYKSSGGWSETRSFNGTGWDSIGEVIDGNLLVSGSIAADKLAINDLFAQTVNVTGQLRVGNDTSFVRLGDSQGSTFIEARRGSERLFMVGNDDGFVNGRYLSLNSIGFSALSSEALTGIQEFLGLNTSSGGSLSTTTSLTSKTLRLPPFNSNGAPLRFTVASGGAQTVINQATSWPEPIVTVILKRDNVTLHQKTFRGWVWEEAFGGGGFGEPTRSLIEVALPVISWEVVEEFPPTGENDYDLVLVVEHWPTAADTFHVVTPDCTISLTQASGLGGGGGGGSWEQITQKPFDSLGDRLHVEAGALTVKSTSSRTSNATDTVLEAKALNDHRQSGDHDDRYLQSSGSKTLSGITTVSDRFVLTDTVRTLSFGQSEIGFIEYGTYGIRLRTRASAGGALTGALTLGVNGNLTHTGGIIVGDGSGLTGTANNLRARATTKDDVGLAHVQNRAFNWQWGTQSPTHIWASPGNSTHQYVYTPNDIRDAMDLRWSDIDGGSATLVSLSDNPSDPASRSVGDLWMRNGILRYVDSGGAVRQIAQTNNWSAMSVAEGIAGSSGTTRFINASNLKQIIEHYLANSTTSGLPVVNTSRFYQTSHGDDYRMAIQGAIDFVEASGVRQVVYIDNAPTFEGHLIQSSITLSGLDSHPGTGTNNWASENGKRVALLIRRPDLVVLRAHKQTIRLSDVPATRSLDSFLAVIPTLNDHKTELHLEELRLIGGPFANISHRPNYIVRADYRAMSYSRIKNCQFAFASIDVVRLTGFVVHFSHVRARFAGPQGTGFRAVGRSLAFPNGEGAMTAHYYEHCTVDYAGWHGFWMDGASGHTYCTFMNCHVDFIGRNESQATIPGNNSVAAGYKIVDVRGVTMHGCGVEFSTRALRLHGTRTLSIDTLFCLGLGTTNNVKVPEYVEITGYAESVSIRKFENRSPTSGGADHWVSITTPSAYNTNQLDIDNSIPRNQIKWLGGNVTSAPSLVTTINDFYRNNTRCPGGGVVLEGKPLEGSNNAWLNHSTQAAEHTWKFDTATAWYTHPILEVENFSQGGTLAIAVEIFAARTDSAQSLPAKYLITAKAALNDGGAFVSTPSKIGTGATISVNLQWSGRVLQLQCNTPWTAYFVKATAFGRVSTQSMFFKWLD